MSEDDDRLRQLLRSVVPELDGVDATGLRPTAPRPRRRVPEVAAVALAVVGVSVGVLLIRAGTPSHSSAAVVSAAHSATGASHRLAAAELAALTRDAPCLNPTGRPLATRAQLRAFHPVAAVRCSEREARYSDGEWTVVIRSASQTGVGALDQPNQSPTHGACATMAVANPSLALIDAQGRVLLPRFPLDECHQPDSAPLAALTDWTVVSTQKLTLQRSPAELAAHCQGAWKNENYLYEKFREQASDGGPVLTSHPNNKLSVCIYQIRASDPEVGDFLRGLVLDAAASENLRAALGGAGPRGTCPLQRQFAVISTPPGAEVNVELGGCWRVQRNDGGRQTTGSAEPTVVRSILGIS